MCGKNCRSPFTSTHSDSSIYRQCVLLSVCVVQVLTDVNVDCLLARESLRMMYEMVIPRWHFHMLNDFVRNSSYSQSILRAVARIPDCTILDIGSGTGLLRY